MTSRSHLPIFRDNSPSWLAQQLGYSIKYVRAVKYGSKPLTARFRLACGHALQRTDIELFGEVIS